jgi:rod shape-determining protein MreC
MSDSRDDFIIALRYSLLKKGVKQKFSLFFLIILSISIIILDKFSSPPVNFLRVVTKEIVYRVTYIAILPNKALSYLGSKSVEHMTLYKKNITLSNELSVLKKKDFDISYLKTENENLKIALGLEKVKNRSDDTILISKVSVDLSSPFLKSLLISKGTKHGIKKGMTVFSKNYLIGNVIDTNYLSSRVLLITDLNSKIPSVIQDSDVNVILGGNGNKNDFKLEYLPENFVLEPNKIIYTSGKDGFLKAGMPIAETYLKKNKIKVRSLTDPQQASIVHITLGQIKD